VSEEALPTEGKPDLVFPHGFLSFRVTGLVPADTVVLTITFASSIPSGVCSFWKYGPTPTDPRQHWYPLPIGHDNGDSVMTVTLTDGGPGDHDLTANGVIVDPGGLGVPSSVPSSHGYADYGHSLRSLPELVSSASVTQTGSDLVVDFPRVGSLIFSIVDSTGIVDIYSDMGVMRQRGFILAGQVLRILGSLQFSGPIAVSLIFAVPYGQDVNQARLYQWDGTSWRDITTGLTVGDAGWGTVTGTTTTLGLFRVSFAPNGPAASPSESPQNAPAKLTVDVGLVPAVGLMALAVAGTAAWGSSLRTTAPSNRKRAARRRNG